MANTPQNATHTSAPAEADRYEHFEVTMDPSRIHRMTHAEIPTSEGTPPLSREQIEHFIRTAPQRSRQLIDRLSQTPQDRALLCSRPDTSD